MQLHLGHRVTPIAPRFTLLRACGSLRFLGFFLSLLSIFWRDSGCIVGGVLLWGFECRLSHCEDAVNDTSSGWLTSHQGASLSSSQNVVLLLLILETGQWVGYH